MPEAPSWPIIAGAAAGLGCAFFAGKYMGTANTKVQAKPDEAASVQAIRYFICIL